MTTVQDLSCFIIRCCVKLNAAGSDVGDRGREADSQRPPLIERNVSCPMYSFLEGLSSSCGDEWNGSGRSISIRKLIAATASLRLFEAAYQGLPKGEDVSRPSLALRA